MALWLEQLLADPALGLELLAGSGGLASRGPVRWAHISEIPDPTPWLEGGEVLLTTGLGTNGRPDLQQRLVAGLDECGCAGIGFGLGVVVDAVPHAMLAEADRRGLPLFTVPYEVPFIAVTKRVSHSAFAEHYATLRSAVDLHRKVLGAVISGAGVDTVLRTAARMTPDFTWVAFDYYGRVLAAITAPGRAAPTPGDLWPLVSPTRHERDRFEETAGQLVVSGALVRIGAEVEAVLAVAGPRRPREHEALMVEQGLAGLSLELARGLSIREAHRALVDGVLEDAATGRAGSQELERRLVRADFDPNRTYHVLCLQPPPGVPSRAVMTLAEDILGDDTRPVVGQWDGAVVALAQPEGTDHAERLHAAAAERGWGGLRVGRSRGRTSVTALASGLREASAAADAADQAGGVRDVTSLGVVGLVAGIAQGGGSEAFVTAILGPVLAHDGGQAGSLLDTLTAYLRHGCRPGPAARALQVHRHTLTYRLDRIAQLCGRDPRDGRHLLEFGLAVELHARGTRPPTAAAQAGP